MAYGLQEEVSLALLHLVMHLLVHFHALSQEHATLQPQQPHSPWSLGCTYRLQAGAETDSSQEQAKLPG